MKSGISINLFRICILVLIIFEFLNYFGALHFVLDFTWLGLIVTSFLAWIVVEIVIYYFFHITKKQLPFWILLLILLMVYLDALADVRNLYSQYSWFDQFLHFFSGLAIFSVLFYIFYYLEKAKVLKMGVFGISLLAVCLTVMLGVFYELEEYFEDVINGSNRLGDGFDTANDMMLCLLGALIMMLVINLIFKFKNKKISLH